MLFLNILLVCNWIMFTNYDQTIHPKQYLKGNYYQMVHSKECLQTITREFILKYYYKTHANNHCKLLLGNSFQTKLFIIGQIIPHNIYCY